MKRFLIWLKRPSRIAAAGLTLIGVFMLLGGFRLLKLVDTLPTSISKNLSALFLSAAITLLVSSYLRRKYKRQHAMWSIKVKQVKKDKEDYEQEYAHASESLRSYNNLRYAILPVFAAITAALVGFFEDGNADSVSLPLVIKLGGLLITFTLWMYDLTVRTRIHVTLHRAVYLERRLEYDLLSNRPKATAFGGTGNASCLLFGSVFWFWVFSILSCTI